MKRNKRGITLIALIITIIVLLILAGVTMSFVVGDNGVVTQAQKAKIRTDKESAEEEVKLEVAGSYDDEGNLDLELLNKNLMNNLKDLKLKDKTTGEYKEFTETNKIENLPATVYYKQNEVTINGKQLISDVAKNVENYGMYVNYPIDLSGDGDTTNDWRIFYEDETGRVFLIAADYVPNTCSALKKEDGSLIAGMVESNNGDVYKKCCYRWTSGPEYTCYDGREETQCNNKKKESKSQCSFPNIFMPNVDTCKGHYYCSDHVGTDGKTGGNSNSRCAGALQCTGAWSGFVNSSYAEYAIGGPTLEMWLGSWNSHTDKNKYENVVYNASSSNGVGYAYGENGGSSTSHQMTGNGDDNGKKDTLYFPHPSSSSNLDLFDDKYDSTSSKGNEEENKTSEGASCSAYWLASPSADSSYDVMYVYYGGSLTSNGCSYSNVGVRPVVSLKSGVYVKVEEDEVKDGKTVKRSCTLVK